MFYIIYGLFNLCQKVFIILLFSDLLVDKYRIGEESDLLSPNHLLIIYIMIKETDNHIRGVTQ